jgi:hypothetical protein
MPAEFSSERALCPGCGAALSLEGSEAIVACRYCGTESKVVFRLRRVEPDFERLPPPRVVIDPVKEFERWGTAQLIAGILTETETPRRVAMARALDEWPHVNDTAAAYIPHLIEVMLGAPAELDKALSGILGKLVCADDLKFKAAVIRHAERYAFALPGSKGLLFALSLGDAGTVKILLDVADWAARHGSQGKGSYGEAAIYGVQTAIGRERDHHEVCTQVLCHRLFYVHGEVAAWVMRFLRNEFDVGYRYHREWVVDLIEEAAHERPELVDGLRHALKLGAGTQDAAQFSRWLSRLRSFRSVAGREAVLACMARPVGLDAGGVTAAISALEPLLGEAALAEATDEALAALVNLSEQAPARMLELKHAGRLGKRTLHALGRK